MQHDRTKELVDAFSRAQVRLAAGLPRPLAAVLLTNAGGEARRRGRGVKELGGRSKRAIASSLFNFCLCLIYYLTILAATGSATSRPPDGCGCLAEARGRKRSEEALLSGDLIL